jgi:hypothetical protein
LHTFVFIKPEATLYDGVGDMITPIDSALLEISYESTVVLYSPTPDRAFRALIRDATGCISCQFLKN